MLQIYAEKYFQNFILIKIFFKNLIKNNDIFFNPIDIGDNTIPNGNAIMLINLVRLGLMNEAKLLSNSLNGYLNIYKNHMITAIRALDFYNKLKEGKNCNEKGCLIDEKNIRFLIWFGWLILVILWNYGYPSASPFEDVFVAIVLSIFNVLILKFIKKILTIN